jgi:hypothetical protein
VIKIKIINEVKQINSLWYSQSELGELQSIILVTQSSTLQLTAGRPRQLFMQQYIVIAYDGTDSDALERRMAVRLFTLRRLGK